MNTDKENGIVTLDTSDMACSDSKQIMFNISASRAPVANLGTNIDSDMI